MAYIKKHINLTDNDIFELSKGVSTLSIQNSSTISPELSDYSCEIYQAKVDVASFLEPKASSHIDKEAEPVPKDFFSKSNSLTCIIIWIIQK